MKKFLFTPIILSLLVIAGCSHTNELANFNLRGQSFLFNNTVASDAKKVSVTTNDPVNSNSNKSDAAKIFSAIASISRDIISSDAQEKLEKAVNTKMLADNVSLGLENALRTYLNAKKVDNVDENPAFVAETRLEDCKLYVQKSATYIYVKAESTIIERASGKIVWQNSESESVPLSKDGTTYGNSDNAIDNVFNVVQLASLTEEELNRIVDRSAEQVGYDMGTTLREDIADSK